MNEIRISTLKTSQKIKKVNSGNYFFYIHSLYIRKLIQVKS